MHPWPIHSLTAGIFRNAGLFWAVYFAHTLKDKMMQSCFAVDNGGDLKLSQHSWAPAWP